MVVANYDDSTISVLLNGGTGSMGTATNYGTGANPHFVRLGDMNGGVPQAQERMVFSVA
jgi:hypothetical protein